jgi:hypothetical protein
MATAIFDFYPYACPQCATPLKLDERDYLSGAPHTCNCGLHFRYDKKAIEQEDNNETRRQSKNHQVG